MIRAVFFDWGNTLCAWEFDPQLLAEGHVRGLAAAGGDGTRQESFTRAYIERILPRLVAANEDEVDYAAEVAALLTDLGVASGRHAADRFVEAEHAVWRPAHVIEPPVMELLDALRERGLVVGLVSNVFDPPSLMRGLFAELGLMARLDVLALSTEVGKRKPHPRIFHAALEQAGVAPAEAMMVGDRLSEDVAGAQAVGLRTVQALWFSRDECGAAVPDETAETPAGVLSLLGTT